MMFRSSRGRGVLGVVLIGIAGAAANPADAAYIRYEFQIDQFRTSSSQFAPYEQMTGLVELDVDYTTGALNSVLGGSVGLTNGPSGPVVIDQSFSVYRIYGAPLGVTVDSSGGSYDFYLGLDISGGVTNPTLSSNIATYALATGSPNSYVYDPQNGSVSIQVFDTPVPEPGTLAIIGLVGLAAIRRRRPQ